MFFFDNVARANSRIAARCTAKTTLLVLPDKTEAQPVPQTAHKHKHFEARARPTRDPSIFHTLASRSHGLSCRQPPAKILRGDPGEEP